jgi:hypothetical protein
MAVVPPYRYSVAFFVVLPGRFPGDPNQFMPGDYDVVLDVPISGPHTKNQVRQQILSEFQQQGVPAVGVNIMSWQRYEDPGPRSGTEVQA